MAEIHLGRVGPRQPVPPPMPVSNKVGEIVVRATVGEVGLAALWRVQACW